MIDQIQNLGSLSKVSGLGTTDAASSTTTTVGATPGSMTGMSFASVLGDMANSTVNNLKQAEAASFDGITGKVSTREVVDAVMAAEQSLQTAIALRDKIVSAYLEITKMQI
ncbi:MULTISPECIES: flagellar hook-basal body complex protein FliE [Alphaproteobacteria]|uniref:Flagellar hook-basal body complex protein FliE n=2 Tax=Alphaproteobacteria TaxID=28211 RepID=A0A512HDB5_9HYPH|nr:MULTISPECIES: flagellar hook-basal body complex protein FliE [Alphaproteobacteria]GEO83444.1 flagellar hook-basal body complex protein FliE [Ciceribacter naphthalenivorans]GLR24406.1 flagellar hook-basal body complex protein FliE [Ciceribacter naphthalenivorans]GLT07262.1 flagellar hook-basal body complex protein FliE [Sphingomonas psychrolutea]